VVDIRARPFQAPHSVPMPAAERPTTERDGKPAPDPGASPAAAANTFGAAVGAAEALYTRLVAAARQIGSDAAAENKDSAARTEDALDSDLNELGDTLKRNQISLDRARDFSLDKVHSWASGMRRKINGAAGSAFGRLSAMRTVYEGLMSRPRERRAAVELNLSTTLSQLTTKSNAAHTALQQFAAHPERKLSAYTDFEGANSSIIAAAKLEAALQYIVPYINADDQAMADRLGVIEGGLDPLRRCLPCQMDGAFQLLDMRMDHLAVAGPRAVRASRDGALKSVDDLVERLSLTIEDTHCTLSRHLVGQHDRARRDLIAQERLSGEAERDELRSAASRSVDTLTAVAEGQARGAIEAHERLANSSARRDYAAVLMAGAHRLRANIAGMSRRYPGDQLSIAQARTAARGKRRAQGSLLRARSVQGVDQMMAEMIRSSFSDLDQGSEKSFLDMHDTPQRVRSSCESFLGPAEGQRNREVANLRAQVSKIDHQVTAAINGEPSGGTSDSGAGGMSQSQPEANVCSAPPAVSMSLPESTSSAQTGAAGGGGARQTMPPPASCGGCPSGHGEADDGDQATTPRTDTAANTPGTGQAGQGVTGQTQTQPPPASSRPGDNYLSSVDFRAYCTDVAADPKQASGTKGFIADVNKKVAKELWDRAHNAHSGLDHWRQPDTPALMAALRGLTAAAGAALEQEYSLDRLGELRARINEKYDDAYLYTLAAPSTIEWNRRGALDALNGDVTGAAMNELRAAFNYSNEDTRIRDIMSHLTPAQMDALPAKELDELAKQLDGEDLARFNAMRQGHSRGIDRAAILADAVDAANRKEGDERGRALQGAFSTAYTAPELAIEGPADQQAADIFGLEEPHQRTARQAAHWHQTLSSFSQLDRVQTTLAQAGPAATTQRPTGAAATTSQPTVAGAPATGGTGTTSTAPPGAPGATTPNPAGSPSGPATDPAADPDAALRDILIRYATRPIDHPPPPRGGAQRDFDSGDTGAWRTDVVQADMVNWISQTAAHGPESIEARAAQLVVEFHRASASGSAGRVDLALHMGSADAREGGGYEERSTAKAEQDRDLIFQQFARYREELGDKPPLVGPIDVRSVRQEVADHFSTALARDPHARDIAVGIISGEMGNPRAVIDYAIEHENPELALRYLRRMDRNQIDRLVEDWNSDPANHGKNLYEVLGLFQHHWSITHWTGSVFSGDEANELEIAFMGVPQNDQERAEVALRTMNQQIEQSTRLGRLLAGDEYDRLVANRNALLRLTGHNNKDFDERGRLRVYDPDTHETMHLGNFDEKGNFLPPRPGQASAFERAIGLARYSATDFTQAVDAAANFFTTLLVVIAAVVTTALTGGAAASIWIPMLVTAAAGLAGVALTAAIKGGRYSRDEMVRDLIMVAVQTVTAGIGAAGSVAARGGLPALRAVASRGISQGFKISEKALERFVISKGGSLAAQAGLGAELAIGAAGGALSGGVGAALDPANRRSDDYGSRIWGGIWRGAAGGAAGAGVARGVGAGVGKIGNRITGNAALDSARRALASGLPREQAIEQALLAARRTSWVTSGVTRALASGASGSASRITELSLEGRASFGEIMDEARFAFIQNVLQGAMEHAVDPGHQVAARRGGTAFSEDELNRLPKSQREEQENLQAMARGAVARAYDAATPTRTGAAQETTSRPRPPAAQAPVEDGVTRGPSVHPDEEIELPRMRLRTVGGDDDDRGEITQKIRRVTLADLLASTEPRPGPIFDRVDITPEMLRGGRSIPEHSMFRGVDDRDPVAARRNYNALVAADPHREVLLAHNPRTGEYMVIQGGEHSVSAPPEGWITERHSHPRLVSETQAERLTRALPSATGGDFVVLQGEVDRLAGTIPAHVPVTRNSVIDININGQRSETHFSITRTGDEYRLTVTFRPPHDGVETLGPFHSIADYEAKALQLTGVDFSRPTDRTVRTVEGRPRAVIGEALTAGQRSEVEAIAGPPREGEPLAAGRTVSGAEAQQRVRAMGLVGEPDSMVRLFNILNDRTIPEASKAIVAKAVLEATRQSMIASGEIGAADELMMFFHGAEREQFESYRGRGIDMSLKPGSHANDDVGAGLYISQDYESARLYAAGGGAVVPFIARRADLGHVVDIRPGSLLRARWEAFFSANFGRPGFGEAFAAAMLRPGGFRLPSGEPLPIGPGGFGLFTTEKAGRGLLMAEFLVELQNDSSLPESVRTAAREPHIIMTDLGGPGTHGTDRGFITDQAAFKTQAIADLVNRQMGFGEFSAANDNDPHSTRLRSVGFVPEEQVSPLGRMIGALLENIGRGPRDVDGHLGELMRLAPEATTAFFTEVARLGGSGEIVEPSDMHMLRLTLEMRSRGAPPDLVEAMRTRFRALADAKHPVFLSVTMAGAHTGFAAGLGVHLERAFVRRAAIEAARKYGYHGATDEQRQLVHTARLKDREAVARLIIGQGSADERAAQYATARMNRGEDYLDALSEGYALVRAVESSDFGKAQKAVESRLRAVNRLESLAKMIRERPDSLLDLAHTDPQQLAELYVDLVYKNIRQKVTEPIDAARLAQYVGRRMVANFLPIAGELSVVFSLQEMGVTLLKSEPTLGGGANRPGLDIVGFTRTNGNPVPPGPVRVLIADNKATYTDELRHVSAMFGKRYVTNLRETAAEIRGHVARLEAIPALASHPEYIEFFAGARAAAKQMEDAAKDISRVRVPYVPEGPATPAQRARLEAYGRRIADIMHEHNIDQLLTSRHGDVRELASWLRSQGFMLEEEYLRKLHPMFRR